MLGHASDAGLQAPGVEHSRTVYERARPRAILTIRAGPHPSNKNALACVPKSTTAPGL